MNFGCFPASRLAGRKWSEWQDLNSATPVSRTQCSTRLSHTPTWRPAFIGGGFEWRKRLFRGSRDDPKVLNGPVASVRVVSYFHRLAEPRGVSPFLLGNGVMVTLRFLRTVILGSSPVSQPLPSITSRADLQLLHAFPRRMRAPVAVVRVAVSARFRGGPRPGRRGGGVDGGVDTIDWQVHSRNDHVGPRPFSGREGNRRRFER